MNDGEGLSGQLDGASDGGQIVGQQRDLPRLKRDLGSRSHRKSDIGLSEGRGVVDAISHHADACAGFAGGLYRGELVLGREACANLRQPGFMAYRLRDVERISGEHRQSQSETFERGHRCAGGVAERVGYFNLTEDQIAVCDKYDPRAVFDW